MYTKSRKSYLNIAMIGHKRIPSREGGIEIVVEELSVRMVNRGHNVTVYNRLGHHVSGKDYDSIARKRNCLYKGVNIISVPTIDYRGLAAVTSSFFATIKALFGHYDCIHYHAEGPCIMLWIPHLFHIRTVATIHGLDWRRSKWGKFATWYLKMGEKIAVKYADEIIVLSKNVQDYFNKIYGRDTIFIPNGVEKPQLRTPTIINQNWGLTENSYICYLSRIVPEKGVQYLIEAFKQLNTDKRLVIAGGSSDTDDFYNKVRNDAEDDKRIIFTGFVQGQFLEELLSNAYVYVLPSDLEGMPLSLLEAMSYGNCCVVSNINECTEVVEDRAVIFKKSDVSDLKSKLQQLCDDKNMQEQYKASTTDFVLNKYNWEDVVDQTLKLYI